ncbi:MAG: helicase-associated domain-containing protein [Anaerolineae bacterium]|jgi:hypothetical protein
MHDLRRFLVDYDMAMLRALAENRGISLATNVHAEAVDQMAQALLAPLSVRTALAHLSPPARQALETLLAAGGRLRAPQFARAFGQIRPIGPGRLAREAPWQEPASPAEELWYAGLLYRGFFDDKGGPGEFVTVPDDLRPLLPHPKVEAPPFRVEVVPPPPAAGAPRRTLVDDLFAYLVYLQTHDVRPYADGRLGRRDLAALKVRMGDVEPRRLALVRYLADQLAFVARPELFFRLEAAPVKDWLSAPPTEQAAILYRTWHDDPTWHDLCRVPSLACDDTPWLQHYDPVAARRALLALLAHCPPDEWWSLASFVAAVKERNPDFQRPDGDYTSWYIRDAASGEYLSGFESWDHVEGALVADLLAGPLRWLGLVAAGRGEAGPACCLTETGRRLLGLTAAEPENWPPPPIVVHPDRRIEVPPPASLYTCFQLERFAQPRALPALPRGTGETRYYHLTVEALGRALERGIRVEQVLAFLKQASGDRLPAAVADQLGLWAGRYGQVHLGEVILLTTRSEKALQELATLPETRNLIARKLSPTTALVRKQDLPRLERALRALGFLPPAEPPGDPVEHG